MIRDAKHLEGARGATDDWIYRLRRRYALPQAVARTYTQEEQQCELTTDWGGAQERRDRKTRESLRGDNV